MIAVFAFAAAIQAVPSPAEEEIVVIGQRLARLSAFVRQDGGRLSCSLSESSGNARLDARLCRTAARCVRDGARENDAVRACIDRRRPALLADLRRFLAEGRR